MKLAKQNPKAFFKHVKSKLNTRTRKADLRTTDDQVISDDMEKAQNFNEFFNSVYAREELDGILEVTNQVPTVHQGASRSKQCGDRRDRSNGFIEKISDRQFTGPRFVSHPRVLKICATEMAHPLTVLF